MKTTETRHTFKLKCGCEGKITVDLYDDMDLETGKEFKRESGLHMKYKPCSGKHTWFGAGVE